MPGSPEQLRELLTRPAAEVAPELLGWTLRHTDAQGTVVQTLNGPPRAGVQTVRWNMRGVPG